MGVGLVRVTEDNCYQVVWEVVQELSKQFGPGVRVVHGRPMYQGTETPDDDGRYGHAWVEYDGDVYDFSHGKEVVIDVDLYYAIGRIEPEKVIKFTLDEFREKILEEGTWGPWD